MENELKLNTEKFQKYLTLYKEKFEEKNTKKLKKWRFVKDFQDNWKEDAENFPEMLEKALKLEKALDKDDKLLSGDRYNPKLGIIKIVKNNPKDVQRLFLSLFEESKGKDFIERAKEFKSATDPLIKANFPGTTKGGYDKWITREQDARAISTYLWLRYPDKYYIFKHKEADKVAKLLFNMPKMDMGFEGMKKSYKLSEILKKELKKDTELIRMLKENLTEDCYPDESLNTLTYDFIDFVGNYSETPPIDGPPPTTEKEENSTHYDGPKNIIFYGPPGTGKTYNSVYYAMAIIENKTYEDVKGENYENIQQRFKEYKERGLVQFTTFHQSYGYEDFIEGIRPVLETPKDNDKNTEVTGDNDSTNKLKYELYDGIFKSFCKGKMNINYDIDFEKALSNEPNIWKVSLYESGDNHIRTDCFKNNYIRIGFDEYGDIRTIHDNIKRGKFVLKDFYENMKLGDIVVSCYNSKEIDAIGIIEGEPEWKDAFQELKRVRKVKWLVKNVKLDITEFNQGKELTARTIYKLDWPISDLKEIYKKMNEKYIEEVYEKKNRVFIIDEINRGNISKIFGELITLIEPQRRIGEKEELMIKLPYSGEEFGVPKNVHLIGTMNSADRSIALMDVALRRRFNFLEMRPDYELLKKETPIVKEREFTIDIPLMLETLNKRIAILLDREHVIGHSYFLSLKNCKEDKKFEMLGDVFKNNIIPLLQEYFFDDYKKISLVLGCKNYDDSDFIKKIKTLDKNEAFNDYISEYELPEDYYEINQDAFKNPKAYISIYSEPE